MNRANRRAVIVVSVTTFVVVVLGLLAGSELAFRYSWATSALAEIAPRYARLAGLKEAGGTINAQLAQVESSIARVAYPAGTESDRIGTELQQRIRELATAAGLSVTGSQILTPRTEQNLQKVLLSGSFQGGPQQLRDFLVAVHNAEPAILIDKLSAQGMRRGRQQGAPDALAVQIQFSAFHLLP